MSKIELEILKIESKRDVRTNLLPPYRDTNKHFSKLEINQHFIVITIEHFTNHFRGRRMNESVRDFI